MLWGGRLRTVKDQLGAARALVVDAPCDPDLLVLGRLARLEVAKLGLELGVVVRDIELVRVRVGLGVLEHCSRGDMESVHAALCHGAWRGEGPTHAR